ncbi:four-carbon acid sugar kinase family protein [Eubacterium sp. 1001713B170207_170306_E7]|uniref:four-carbon acid sugar kinase family protein n=1 Tax=Eubacterium sp. 1001713B170207_170306_E7 TaxID=2787097 RepID=UPI0018983183|nr:four-carbon acid sugar kinase family protein [Eubacterium sp. 1001713B170207_170306_E7]
MARAVIIADDLTGANVTGALLRKNGYRFATFRRSASVGPEVLSDYDAVAVSTDSRGITPGAAWAAVSETARAFPLPEDGFYQKRIDSTLRGNIGAEIDGLLDTLGGEAVALVCAAYPDVDKRVAGDYLLVEGELLERTGVSRDPKCPVTQSSVRAILEKQTRYPVGTICMDVVAQGAEAIRAAAVQLIRQGVRIISFDAVAGSDITAIAQAGTALGHPFITVDPGPLTLACLNVGKKQRPRKQVLMAIGSVVPIVRQQAEAFEAFFKTELVQADVLALLDENRCAAERQRIFTALDKCAGHSDFVGIMTAKHEADVLDLRQTAEYFGCDVETLSGRISQAIASLAAAYLKAHSHEIQALYTSGGDITLGVCEALESAGICVLDEIEPFTMYGELIGGRYSGLPIVTKGGLAGKVETLRNAMSYLQIKLAEKE